MNKINIFWGSDEIFAEATNGLTDFNYLTDVLEHIRKEKLVIAGHAPDKPDDPMKVENLIVHTDDYGGINEWAMLGFTNNILQNLRVDIHNLWLCNPPKQIYQDIRRNFSEETIDEHPAIYPEIELDALKKMATDFDSHVIGQSHVIKTALSAIYGLRNPSRKRPVTLLFLGDSGIGKTATAKFISECIGKEMVRIQFSMQQTTTAYQYIFGAEHGEDSLARALIRRNSNVVLLDEFDKVPSAFYNAFYQMFDEGMFVDSNYSVDVSKCVIICTTNYTTEEEAEKNLGAPIYSRFSKVIKFVPISVENKLQIAENCYESVLGDVQAEDRALIVDNNILAFFKEHIKNGSYPNIRMLKNDIEDAINFEILKKRNIL